ncbi:MAG: RIP metalloprotease RseP [Lachnospiraceae bacterium]|nr:RIP metalloprotease RseP [Lachnospiraceae bacterium]
MNSPVLTIISFLIIFSVVVISHEFGHFLIARLNGIKVNEFSVGMGPALYRKKGKNTEYVIRLLPFGGACIFEGMTGMETSGDDEEDDVDSEDEKDEKTEDKTVTFKPGDFNAAPVWGRIATVLAGPVFNLILAYLIGLFIVWFCGADLPVVAKVSEGMPAAEAGFQAGDEIISIDGHRTLLWREIMIRSVLSTGKEMHIVYERNGEKLETTLIPVWSGTDGRYYIGFAGGSEVIKCNNLKVFKYSAIEVRYWLDATMQSLKYMITGHAKPDDLAGPVGIANVIDDTIEDTKEYGTFTVILNIVNIALLLTVNLGVMNLLPLPALDGGRLIFLFFEAVSGRRVPPEKEGFVHMVGIVLLMILMVFVLYNDITRFFR